MKIDKKANNLGSPRQFGSNIQTYAFRYGASHSLAGHGAVAVPEPGGDAGLPGGRGEDGRRRPRH